MPGISGIYKIQSKKKPVMARRPDWLVLTAIGASIAVAVAKEAGDYFLHWGTAEIADISLTWTGGMVALACVALYDWIIYVKRRG